MNFSEGNDKMSAIGRLPETDLYFTRHTQPLCIQDTPRHDTPQPTSLSLPSILPPPWSYIFFLPSGRRAGSHPAVPWVGPSRARLRCQGSLPRIGGSLLGAEFQGFEILLPKRFSCSTNNCTSACRKCHGRLPSFSYISLSEQSF